VFNQVHKLLLFLALLCALAPSSTQAQVIKCPSGFSTSGACGVGLFAGGKAFQLNGSPNGSSPGLSGLQVDLLPTGVVHAAMSLNYQTRVNVQSFTSTFTFVPNGQNVVFMLQNSNNNPIFNGPVFSAGAGCEAGFFQAYSQPVAPNHVFALELDSYSPLAVNESFTYSSAQIYQSGQSPCIPSIQGYPVIDKVSTSPVPLNSPAYAQNTSTGNRYSATVTYNGSNLTLNLYNVTAGGSCPGSRCFTHTWTDVDIPSWVGSDTAWAGFTAATGLPSNHPLYISSFVYNVGAPTPTPTPMPTPSPSCISITAPSNNATISGTIKIATKDTCPGAWFESLLVDGVHAGSFALGAVSYNTTKLSNGVHQFKVTSQSKNPGSVTLGSNSRSFKVQN